MAISIPIFELDAPNLPAGPISFEEYLALDTGELRTEWVNGEVIVIGPLNNENSYLDVTLAAILLAFVQFHRLGTVRREMTMRLPNSGRVPDIVLVLNAHLDRLRASFIDGPADLAIEIVSPDSIERDRITKLREYEAGGVSEYWVLD
jgi:Uma2 family endonuclease